MSLGENSIEMIVIGIAFVCVSVSLISGFILDRFSRRRTFLISFGTALGFLVAFTSVRCLVEENLISGQNSVVQGISIFFIVAHQFVASSAPTVLPFFIAAEIAPLMARSKISSVAMAANGLFAAFETFVYPVLDAKIGIYSIFLLMIAPSVLGGIYLYRILIETKGKTSAEIVNLLKLAAPDRPESQESHFALLNDAKITEICDEQL